jgi:uncharacterized membrane protein YGL010W
MIKEFIMLTLMQGSRQDGANTCPTHRVRSLLQESISHLQVIGIWAFVGHFQKRRSRAWKIVDMNVVAHAVMESNGITALFPGLVLTVIEKSKY